MAFANGLGSMNATQGRAPGMAGGCTCASGGQPGMLDAGMGQMQSMMMSMMASMMAMLTSGMMNQLMSGQGALASGQNPGFGGGAPSMGDATQGFLGSSPSSGGGASAPSSGGQTGPVGSATGQLVDRPGGKLDSSIVANFDAMVAAAKKDGVNLQINSGHRSRAEQERLYAAYKNGTGNLAAKPGTSNHEKGQAIDFKNNPGAYNWLAKNAEKYGFKNLPGEPWHYSPNGR